MPTIRISRGRRLICRKHLANVPIRALICKLHCAPPPPSPLSLSLCLASPRGCTSHCHNQHAVLVISLLITTSHRHTNSSINSIGKWGEYCNHWLLKTQQQRSTNIVHQLLIVNKGKFLSQKRKGLTQCGLLINIPFLGEWNRQLTAMEVDMWSLDWVNVSVPVEFRLGFLHKGCNYYGDKFECGERERWWLLCSVIRLRGEWVCYDVTLGCEVLIQR